MTTLKVYPAGSPLQGQWVLAWQTPAMKGPAFWYYATETEARTQERRFSRPDRVQAGQAVAQAMHFRLPALMALHLAVAGLTANAKLAASGHPTALAVVRADAERYRTELVRLASSPRQAAKLARLLEDRTGVSLEPVPTREAA